MALYLIGIGGTGAKCVEAVTQIAAAGLFTESTIKVLFIDADETNGNLERSRTSIGIYHKCYQLIGSEQQQYGWMRTKLESFDVWSPLGKVSTNKNLGSFFNYNNLKQNNQQLGNLFDVLYTEDEREANLDVGFRGRPAIGSGIMSQVDLDALDEEPWSTIIQQLQADVGGGKSPKVFLCGSMFGGTGASGLPTIARLIANKLSKENVRDRIQIGCLFVLPYFGFSTPTNQNQEEVYARSEQFLLNTEAALRYYVTQAKQTFNTVYLLGNQNFSQYKFSIGKKTQRNEPHFIELYAGLAVRHFLSHNSSEQGQVILISRKELQQLVWSDLPEPDKVQQELVNATRFAYTWLANIAPELAQAKEIGVARFQRGAPWFIKFFRPSTGALGSIFSKKEEGLPDFNDAREQKAIEVISNWCQDYLRWLYQLHQGDGDTIGLFRSNAFANPAGKLSPENLTTLVLGDNRDKGRQSLDTVQELKQRLDPQQLNLMPPNQGTVGLAKSLYIVCRL
ncbi:MAG: hypothetical protein F6K31_13445 [Symploca sp. SIO2G7]|nr:hypothetical protein [Symploca sp. SIO2G7]